MASIYRPIIVLFAYVCDFYGMSYLLDTTITSHLLGATLTKSHTPIAKNTYRGCFFAMRACYRPPFCHLGDRFCRCSSADNNFLFWCVKHLVSFRPSHLALLAAATAIYRSPAHITQADDTCL